MTYCIYSSNSFKIQIEFEYLAKSRTEADYELAHCIQIELLRCFENKEDVEKQWFYLFKGKNNIDGILIKTINVKSY